jgi:hypothetical protein
MRSRGTSQGPSGRGRRGTLLLEAIATAAVTLALLTPVDAQFWGNWGGSSSEQRRPPRPVQQQQQQQQLFNPFGGPGWFDNTPQQREPRAPQREREREAPVDYSHAPSQQKKPDAAASTPVLVFGDGMADWLAYGLEDAFSEKPEISIVRKNRAAAGLIRYDTRRDTEWPQVVREAIAADKPKFIVMMIGVNDRQSIRERVAAATPARPGAARTAPPPGAAPAPTASDPELQARESAQQQNAELLGDAEQPPAETAEPARPANAASGTFDFHTEKWEAAYIKRIDATIAALKSANVPVLWVGLPAQRSGRATSDSAYLNELYRGRAEKAGVTYVDVWDGFVDEASRFMVQGPDVEGQVRRLRAGDGVYFTKAGARKLAHYVEREMLRSIANRAVPVALPAPEPAPVAAGTPAARPSGPAARPLAGPVVPLTILTGGGGDELLGGGPVRGAQPRPAPPIDPVASRVLTKGEAVPAVTGRADDFGWPHGASRAAVEQAVETPPAPAPVAAPAAAPPAASRPMTAAAPPLPAPQPAVETPETRPPARRKSVAPKQPVVRRDVRPEPFSLFGTLPGGWR